METQSRWKSKVLWASIAAQLIALLQIFGVFSTIGTTAGVVGDICTKILMLLATIGIINNPTDKKKL